MYVILIAYCEQHYKYSNTLSNCDVVLLFNINIINKIEVN